MELMCAEVDEEAVLVLEVLPAERAEEELPHGRLAVPLQVRPQVRRLLEPLPAVETLVRRR